MSVASTAAVELQDTYKHARKQQRAFARIKQTKPLDKLSVKQEKLQPLEALTRFIADGAEWQRHVFASNYRLYAQENKVLVLYCTVHDVL